jgi:ELWxxDGT repeat protein
VSTNYFYDDPYPVGDYFGGKFYFCPSNGGDPGYGGLWRSDGTAAGTKKWLDVDCTWLKAAGSRLYFGYADPYGETGGGTLWTSDGTKAGTHLLHEFDSIDAASVTTVGSTLFVAGSDESSEAVDLWRSDGTVAGTSCIAEDIHATELASDGHRLYFQGDGTNGREPWVSDGTPAGTQPAADVLPGADGSYPSGFTALASSVLFFANDGAHGRELWMLPAQ